MSLVVFAAPCTSFFNSPNTIQ